MWVVRSGGCAMLAAAAALSCAIPAAAGGDACDPAINGNFTAVSDGAWAKTNEVYHDEQSVTSTWTVSSSCTNTMDCTGRVESSAGWSANAHCLSGLWYVRRQLDQWEPCADGSFAAGEQSFVFATEPADPTTFTGWDKTVGVSGGCGFNKNLTVAMPFTLTPIG